MSLEAGVLLAFNSQLFANYLEPFRTTGAVIVALFTQVYLTWRKRPQLTIKSRVGDSSPESAEDFAVIRSAEDANEKIVEFLFACGFTPRLRHKTWFRRLLPQSRSEAT